MSYKQAAPFAVQIELTEGCNLRCPFCGLNGIREPKQNNFKFMEPGQLGRIMAQIAEAPGWNPRIEFAMHGEPTMHPEYAHMIGVARKYAPKLQLMMTSNGGGLLKKPGVMENVKELFDAGLNVLALDDYEGIKIVTRIMDTIAASTHEELTKLGDIDIYQYPLEEAGNPHSRRKLSTRTLTLIKDISTAKKGTHSLLNNHAGAGAPKNDDQQGKRCAKPFRELSIRWNGNVAVCCNDWRGEYKCGNVLEDGLLNVWHGPEFTAARRMLYQGRREFGPCMGCDARSYRVGFLPDKLGKRTLPRPNEADAAVIKKALAGRPYTAPVLRPWEIKK